MTFLHGALQFIWMSKPNGLRIETKSGLDAIKPSLTSYSKSWTLQREWWATAL